MASAQLNLNGKKALVAGDSRFWSGYAARALAEAGADVAIACKNARKLAAAAEQVRGCGRKALIYQADMAVESQVAQTVSSVLSEFGGIDILVNAADVRFARPITETTREQWQEVMDANLTPVFLACKAVAGEMLKHQKGNIINICSCLAERGLANLSAYCSAMGGVAQLTRALAMEIGPSGVRISAIAAGWIAETERTGMPLEEQLLRYLPMKRYGRPGEIGTLLQFLASDASDFITGEIIYVDGGVMSHL